MIEITKSEKEALLKQYPHAHVRRTMRQNSKRHRYFCEESSKVIKFLEEYHAATTATE